MTWERLRHTIDDVHLSVDLSDFELFVDEEFSNVMIPHLYVLQLCMINWIPTRCIALCESQCRVGVIWTIRLLV